MALINEISTKLPQNAYSFYFSEKYLKHLIITFSEDLNYEHNAPVNIVPTKRILYKIFSFGILDIIVIVAKLKTSV